MDYPSASAMIRRTFQRAIYHDRQSFRSRNRNCFLDFPITVKILGAKKMEDSESSQMSHYLYEIQVHHGDYKWTIIRRYAQFVDLYKAVKLSRFSLDSNGSEDENEEGKSSPKRGVLQRLTSIASVDEQQEIAHFPKRPEFMLPDEDVSQRQQQLEDYLNSVLRCQDYCNLPEMLEFLEVSELSFAQDLIKGKEGMVKKLAGSDQKRTGVFKWINRCFLYLWSSIVGQRWYRLWLVAQDNCIVLVDVKTGAINAVMLLDQAFDFLEEGKHILTLSNLSQTLTIKTPSSRKQQEWIEALNSMKMRGKDEFLSMNRFNSFAPERTSSQASYFVDGSDYFSAVCDAILNAKEEIFIADWWLSPEIFLKRGPQFDENLRLDKLLKKKAEEGVMIFILLYKEFSIALGLNSYYTKKTLMSSPNIKIMRHPDRITTEMTEFLWAHHEKLVVVDQSLAFVGGLDLCYGRWDNGRHMLTDVTDTVDKPTLVAAKPSTSSSRPMADMPGRHIMFGLQAAHNVTVTPIQAMSNEAQPDSLEKMTSVIKEDERPSGVKLRIRKAYRKARRRITFQSRRHSSVSLDDSVALSSSSNSDDDSSISSTFSDEEVNQHRLRSRISSMARKWRKKSNSVVAPIPVAANKKIELQDVSDVAIEKAASTNVLWRARDYVNFIIKDVDRPDLPEQDNVDRRTTARMPWHDIAVCIEGQAARDVARHFIQRWNAIKTEKAKFSKQYPYLVPRAGSTSLHANSCTTQQPHLQAKNRPASANKAANVKCQVLRSSSQWSVGISQTEDSIYKAMLNAIQEAKYYIYIENQFFITSSKPEEPTAMDANEEIKNRIGHALVQKIIEAHREKKTFRVFVLLPLLPAFEGDISSQSTGRALRTILHYNYSSINRGTYSIFKQLQGQGINPANYISFCSLRQKDELLGNQITELIYIHSKLMIVDDRLVICGSANINDRSLLGNRDSEVAVMIEDTEFNTILMNGIPVPSGKFAASLRQTLMTEHLGLESKTQVEDCICDSFYKDLWLKTASKNTKYYEELFNCIPNDEIKTVEDNRKYLLKPTKAETDKYGTLQKTKLLQGYLVLLPLSYLENENLLPPLPSKEGLAPTILWT